jgi:S1-C subfamily serine protease
VGYPIPGGLDDSPKYTSGDLSSLTANDSLIGLMLVTCPIQPGNSGGALVRDDGQVIGVVCASMSESAFFNATRGRLPQGINYAVRIEYLRQLAQKNSVKIPSPALRVVNPNKVITANSVLVYNWQ